ncbi:hypothetical protein [Runella slithyformis]|uniref:Uncharacterized protein n=1 Tax=Runella slithyformis (strain ATCC 29530 / DSM 19594 / LMG 11500 / NCIMB 11436 / LSU 4) TaxID=761193 RepID=A0A7U3ZH16_RUNSL|nr:hypothetical protein [Runella slithyformis]AEI47063.1 hypothetical protein Runsl_0620 [Runella slithyformis DSM 19594]
MNNTFDLRRFGWYARKEFRENWKAYALSLVSALSILGYFIYQEWGYIHNPYFDKAGYRVNVFRSLALTIGLMSWAAGSYTLKAFSEQKRTFAALILPVSSFERLLYAWTMIVPFSIGVCYLLWKIAWSMALPYFFKDTPGLQVENDTVFWTTNIYFSVFYLGGSASFMLGAVSLGRLNFLKTLGILSGISLVVLNWGQGKFLEVIFPNAYEIRTPGPVPWTTPLVTIESTKGVFSNDIHSSFEGIHQVWWIGCVPLLFYVITFLKIKEKEV